MRCSANIFTRTSRENDKGLYATMIGGRIDPLSCSSSRSVDNMAVWWFRATCFHGLKYLCVNREVLKQNYIMRTEIKGQRNVTVLFPVSLHIRVNNIQERENQTKIPGKWGKKRLRIFP